MGGGLRLFIVCSSTTHGLETILGVDVEGTWGKVWENGEGWAVASVDGGNGGG